MDTRDGGPAFPCTITNVGDVMVMGFGGEEVHPGSTSSYKGMGLRDYFAAKVMQSLAPDMSRMSMEEITSVVVNIPKIAYVLADAMLVARGESK